ncbi:hypothetical protein Tco_1161279 [Tanacetum coccineum]
MVESSKKRKVTNFNFVIKGGEHVHFTAKMIKEQKRIKESLKSDLAKHNEEKVGELIDLIGYDIVAKYYKNKLLYEQVYPNQEEKGWKAIFKQVKPKLDFLHHVEAELKIDFNKPLIEQDPMEELNSLTSKKRKRTDDLHEFLRTTK